MFQEFFLKSMLKRQGMPEEQVDAMLGIVAKNPALFQTIAAEVKEKMDAGAEQSRAMMEVLRAHEEELRILKEGH
ncbi:MAG TPA: hypothetical protein DCZ84_02435 [Candidatus Vogelbacteria bacterium]|uniref:Uncharacterized protein n=1 Tax=Candidatus Vogelbacteria bacterium RIFOXYD1_FULL_51_18 TaxID=1802440 RepID=A0A1G2QM85_9BACT|nr:MAG: hypothetical protein UY66_C0020G0015 [Parcubacteria group bacterium GW2011_GWC1_51_35]KKW24355.1 MAG: hypothetical protein UY68_C0011G0016 [Parcubacteria group bacterium GW2011_GWF2_52_12]KKW27051.1 MAG: hypothetical protein UY69_C0016G0006 [Parcubacteria group bacterium GW2011_GWF1_52_5]KKW34571.1 MAG: hypothetical protein UY80_C0015G0016 [Parcubacteria group bacterium GW2011_GWB1_53_43]OHA61537.1 MAG: hypothetical protein A2569_03435 [Candidatus Vogelbacteria bacterium RIFOXYD1_FULL_5